MWEACDSIVLELVTSAPNERLSPVSGSLALLKEPSMFSSSFDLSLSRHFVTRVRVNYSFSLKVYWEYIFQLCTCLHDPRQHWGEFQDVRQPRNRRKLWSTKYPSEIFTRFMTTIARWIDLIKKCASSAWRLEKSWPRARAPPIYN